MLHLEILSPLHASFGNSLALACFIWKFSLPCMLHLEILSPLHASFGNSLALACFIWKFSRPCMHHLKILSPLHASLGNSLALACFIWKFSRPCTWLYHWFCFAENFFPLRRIPLKFLFHKISDNFFGAFSLSNKELLLLKLRLQIVILKNCSYHR